MNTHPDEFSVHAYRSLFHGHPDATYMFDLSGNFLDCNEALVTLVGRSRSELMAMGFAPIVHPEFIDITAAGFQRAAGGESARYLTRGMRPDSSTFDVDVTNLPLVDGDGNVIAVMGIARDVGHVQALSDAVERNATVMRIAGRIARFAGWSIDVRSGELFWSTELYRMLSMTDSGGAPPLEAAIAMYPEPHATLMARAVNACINHGEPIDLESVIIDGLGRSLHVRTVGEAIRNDDGEIVTVQGGFFDITDVHTEREERRRLERTLDSTLNSVQDLICFVDRDWRVSFANSAALHFAGMSRAHGYGKTLTELFPDMAPHDFLEAYRQAMDDHLVGRARAFISEFGIWLDLTAYPTDDGAAFIFRDVTDEIVAEEAARAAAEREALQASLFEISSNAIFTYDADRRITLWNPAAARLYDCAADEAVGSLVDDVIIADGPSVAELAGDELERTGQWKGTLKQKTRSGTSLIVESRAQLITTGDAAGSIMASNTDVTQREAERREKAHTELRLQETLEQIQDGICFFDREWRYTFMNATFEKLNQRPAELLLGKVIWDEYPEAVGSSFEATYRRAMDDREVSMVRDYFAPLDTWFDITAYPTDEGIALYLRDVSQEERSSHAIRQANENAREQAALLDAARDIILMLSLDGELRYANKSAQSRFTDLSLDKPGRTLGSALGVSHSILDEAITAVTQTGEWDGELTHALPDGTIMITDARWQLISNDSDQPTSILAVHTDVTADREQELARNRAQRLESLGTLAGGIAHDLNNVLTPILMSSQLVASMTDDDNMRTLLTAIETSAKRGSDMIRQVLAFARGTDGSHAVVDPRDVLEDLRQLTAESLPKNVRLTVAGDDLDPVTGDATQILQVLLNLVTNAADAMPGGGRLEVNGRMVRLSAQPESPLIGVNQCLAISVTDSGTGIDEAIREKIFEPFFTTKDIGKGTGLGLATSLAIVRSHGGDITVESTPGSGTTFTVYLPAAEHDPPPVQRPVADDVAPEGKNELVLVVDDEDSIRQIVLETLRSHGYRTLEAVNGRHAIEVAEAAGEPVSAVVTDMMMPVMDGAATARYFFDHYPETAVIAASGLNATSGVARATHAGVQYFVPKPFTISTLLSTLRTAIDDRARGLPSPVLDAQTTSEGTNR